MCNLKTVAIIVLVILMIGYFFNIFGTKLINQENFFADTSDDIRNPYFGDDVLRNLYRNMHNLEAVERIEIAQNNGAGGGNQGVNQQQYLLEQSYLEGSRMREQAMRDIAKRRAPFVPQNPPPIGNSFDECHYGNCQFDMDYNERILGIPSVPGNIHSYYSL